MNVRRIRSAVLALVAAAGLCTLAACGGGSEASVSITALQTAAANTQHAGTREYSFTMSGTAKGEDVDVHGTVLAAADGSRARATLDLGGHGTLQELVVDHDVYVSADGMLGGLLALPKGATWIKLDLDELGEYLGQDPGVPGAGQADPGERGLEALQGLSGDVEKVGDDTVAGEHATHYRAQIDYAKVAAKLPDPTSDAAARLRKVGTVPADVWIDDQDRVVKARFEMDGGMLGSSASDTVVMTMEITGFDVPVDVEAPPADQVVDFGDVFGGILGGGSSSGSGTQI
jgi:hypothetical protein